MKKIIVYSAFLIPLLLSCVSEKGIAFNDIPKYENNKGYKNLYMVDTIRIDTPVRFFTKSGYEFIMSKKNFDSFNGTEKELFKRNDAFLVGDLTMSYPVSVIDKYYIGDDCYKFLKLSYEKKKDIKYIYYFNGKYPDYYILLLVNGDFYNHAFCGIDGAPPIKDKRKKSNYYKVVIPVCIHR
jgi:hypothetical protein